MTKAQLRKKYGELRRKTNTMLRDYLEAALKSGAFDLPSAEDNYRLPKNIMCAALKNASWQWGAFRRSDDKEARNIYRMTPSV